MQKVLIVDDEPIVGDVLHRFLTRLGYDSEVSETASSAIERFDTNPFDLVIMDVNLAERCGFEVARVMQEKKPTQKIVFISGLDREVILHRSTREDVTVSDILVKPFSLDNVRTTVSAALCDGQPLPSGCF